MKFTDITDTDMQTGIKGMKKRKATGIDEMRVQMVMAARRMESAGQRGC